MKNKTLKEEINDIKKKMGLLVEEKHDYGCVMLFFNFPEIKDIHKLIDDDDVYNDPDDDSFGLEDEPHTTLLYGLHKGVSDEDVKKILDKYTFESCKIFNPSLFENEKYDILKFDMKGDSLHSVNKDLKKHPYTSDYPDFHPHLTIAYLKSGTGKKYIDKLKGIKNFLLPKYAIYSKTDGTKVKININVD